MPPLFITKLASWLKNASEDDQEKVDKKIMVHSYKFHIVIQSVLVVLVTYFLNTFFFVFFFQVNLWVAMSYCLSFYLKWF